MELRDMIAMQAMAALIADLSADPLGLSTAAQENMSAEIETRGLTPGSDGFVVVDDPPDYCDVTYTVAEQAYKFADAMLKARNERISCRNEQAIVNPCE